MNQLSPQLDAELKKAWTSAAATGGNAGMPSADAWARADVLYEVTRLLYDETKFDRPVAALEERMSIGEVTDAAMRHNHRAYKVLIGDAITLDPHGDDADDR